MSLPSLFDSPAQPWCQRWTDRQPTWRHPTGPGEHFQPARYDVVRLPEQAARPFVERHHYAATYPASRLAYGLVTDRADFDGTPYEGGLLVGVAVLSVPMQAAVLTNVFPNLEPYRETLELGRFVLTDTCPANSESWMLGRVFALAAADGVRGLVSFSDPMTRTRRTPAGPRTVTPGHVGLIYQATNAVALGRSTPRTLTYLPSHGLVVSDRTMQKVRSGEPGHVGATRRLVALGAPEPLPGEERRLWLARALTELDATRVRHPGNFRYAWPVGTPAQRRRTIVAGPRTPYPKPHRDLFAPTG